MLKTFVKSVCYVSVGFLLAITAIGCGSGYPSTPGTSSPLAVTLTTTSLPQATVGTAYAATLTAVNGTAPYTFNIASGLLPQGLGLSSAGLISGTPTAYGTYTFIASVMDAIQLRATSTVAIVVTPAGVVTTVSLPSTNPAGGIVGSAYTGALVASGGVPPYSFAVIAGMLPAGITLSSAGVYSGTPTISGAFTYTVTVTDDIAQHASATYTATISSKPALLVITTPALEPGEVSYGYSAPFVATGGTTPYAWAVTAGAIPPGLSFSATGILNGTPTTSGTFNFTVTATDAAGTQASQSYSLAIKSQDPLTITTPTLGRAYTSYSYSAPFFANGGLAPYTFAVTGGAIPAGMAFANATLAGTPTTAGTYNFTVTVTDALGSTAIKAYTLLVTSTAGPLTITTPQPGNAYTGYAYSAPWYAANGTPPYSFAITAGAIPAGMTFTNALLSGTPTLGGTVNFTVTVTDAAGATANKAYTLIVQKTGAALAITTPPLGPGYVGASYTGYFYAAYGTTPYTFAVTAGSLPAGMTVTTAGIFSGTPTTAGSDSFTITVTDATQATASQAYTIMIVGGQLVVTTTQLPAAQVNAAYSGPINIGGGTAPYTVTAPASNVPAGLTLSSSGVLSGTPTTAGTYSLPVTVTDSSTPQQVVNANIGLSVNVAATANVTVDMTQVLAVVPATAYGIHTSVYDPKLNDASGIASKLAITGTTVMRYPGGGYSDSFHWAQYAITPLLSSDVPACGVKQNGYLFNTSHFGAFLKTMQAAGAQAVITVNYGASVADSTGTVRYGSDGQKTCSEPNTYGQPQEAAAWVAYANGSPASTQVIGMDATGFDWKTVGFWATMRAATPLPVDDGYNNLRLGLTAPVGIQFWEIGNELYYGGWDSNRNIEDDLHAPYVYPNGYYGGNLQSRAGVAALSPSAYGTNSIAFIQAMKAVDPTIKIGVDLSSPVTDPIVLTWNPDLLQSVCAGSGTTGAVAPDFGILHYYPGTYQDVKASEMLSLPQTDFPRLTALLHSQIAQACPATAATIPLFLTETSPNGNIDGSVPTAVKGLYAMDIFLSALENGIQNVDWLELHDGTYLDEQENPGWAFYGIQMAHNAAGVGDAFVSASSDTGSITAYATAKTGGAKGLVLVNTDPTNPSTVSVTVNGATLGTSATKYTYGINTTQTGTALSTSTFPVNGNTFTVTVPAYTAVELVIP